MGACPVLALLPAAWTPPRGDALVRRPHPPLLPRCQVEFKDPETGEMIDVGLLRCASVKQTAGGGKIDIGRSSGGGAGFGGGEKAEADDDGGDDGEEAEETKLDQFWNFPTIENEVRPRSRVVAPQRCDRCR